jgi:glucose/arabinose dehydrogenase
MTAPRPLALSVLRAAALPALVAALAVPGCGGGGDGSAVDAGPTAADAAPDRPAPSIALVPVATAFERPVLLVSPPDDPRRFVVEQGGLIRILGDGAPLPDPFLDLGAAITTTGNEQGLLGLAFAPDYATSGRFFVGYTASDGANTVAEYRRSAGDPDRADPASGRVLLAIPDTRSNHNGGLIAFGPDGYLYIGTGDGGGGGDPDANGQDVRERLGKILRIDVNSGDPYAIPADNPLVDSATAGVVKEIWHSGVRNPWRWSFDRETGDLWIGDVGQNAWEEIDRIPAGEGGHNLGWSAREGFVCFGAGPCETPASPEPAAAFTDPVVAYSHGDDGLGASVVGGHVYRGDRFPSLRGWYFYADTETDRMWTIDTTARPLAAIELDHGDAAPTIVSFGEDAAGELYVVTLFDGIFALEAR